MEKMKEGKSLVDITCGAMPEIVRKVCGQDAKFAGVDFEQVGSEAIGAVRAKSVDLLTRGALEEKILEIAAAKLQKD
ncbi:MAG: hypothetical protein AAB731_00910 [Patescibacteria group bacterium]